MTDYKQQAKKAAGIKAVEYVDDGMVLGLGTGSTVKYFIEALAARIKAESLEVVGIPTSVATEKLAGALSIPLSTLNDHPEIDLDVDGADEVDPHFNLIKGGGGAHTREKAVAHASKRFIVVADEAKMVMSLGGDAGFPVPLEVLAFTERFVSKKMEVMGASVSRREGFVTDSGNIVLDARMEIEDPISLEKELNAIPGIVENGIFSIRKPEKVIVGLFEGTDKTKIIERV